MRTVSPGFGGVIIGAAMIVSLAYALGDGNMLTELVIGVVQQITAMTGNAVHEAIGSVAALL